MSNYKILIKLTGSIAAYKIAYLISKLVQAGHEVQTVATEAALHFVGKATLEGLSGRSVYTDTFAERKMMGHINLAKWADITLLAPASANTINKIANGIGDNLVTSLFLAHDWNKPYLVAPAMNTAMYEHPATQEAMKKLKEWGVNVLATADGYLACGDYGKGKMLEPDTIFEHINEALNKKKVSANKQNVLITAGGTKEDIDGIRYISNLSTGKTAASVAQHFIDRGYNVTYVHAIDAKLPSGDFTAKLFLGFDDLNSSLKELLSSYNFDFVIHNAAVSDYSVDSLQSGDKTYKIPLTSKLSSDENELTINLKRNFKIIDKIKGYSKKKKHALVAFKFTNEHKEEKRIEQVDKLLTSADYVVLNDYSDRGETNTQQNFSIFDSKGIVSNIENAKELASELEGLLKKEFE
ncbi:bifunctional phosphopantothenoylcysteine decarboxylase/phosphopantothenate--cysteine ligase CoaBC [Bacteroidota bacterium]